MKYKKYSSKKKAKRRKEAYYKRLHQIKEMKLRKKHMRKVDKGVDISEEKRHN